MQSGQSIDLTLQCSLIAQIFLYRADNTRLFELMITKFNAHLFPFPSILCNFAPGNPKLNKVKGTNIFNRYI